MGAHSFSRTGHAPATHFIVFYGEVHGWTGDRRMNGRKKKNPQKKQTAKVFSTHTLTSRGISDANSVQESQQCLLGSLSAVPVGVHRGDIYATPLFCLSITHNLCIVALEMHTPTQDAISHVGKVNECQAKVRQCRRCSLSVSSR